MVDAEGKYLKVISQILEGFRRDNPPTQPKLGVPIAVPIYLLGAAANTGSKKQVIDELSIIKFYFFLWVGKYKYQKPSEHQCMQ